MDTPESKPVKDTDRTDLEKLRGMSFKEKLEFIWEYYKYYIIGTVIAVAIAGSILYSTVLNPSPEPVLFISWNAGFATNEQIDDLKEYLEYHIADKKENEEVVISVFFFDENNPETIMVGHQRMAAMIAAGVIDMFTMDDELLEIYSHNGFIQPLENILVEIDRINPDIYNRIAEHTKYVLYEVEDGFFEERIVAIAIGANPLFSKLGFFEQEMFLGVSVTTGSIENIVKAIILLFE
ncbi:MAG: hypothetical protein FWE83_03135 [Oscillospiraceae bacterium]|nr:hypothetical protein [Oscillospiraceae bacterium]